MKVILDLIKEFFSKNDEQVYTLMFLTVITVVMTLIYYQINGDITGNLLTLNLALIGGLIGKDLANK